MRTTKVEEDIRRASTLPSAFYADPALFERVRERVFARSWQFVADLERVRVPGSVHPVTLLEGFLDEPLLLTRDARTSSTASPTSARTGQPRAPRGTRVAQVLRCRYHGRRFALDGRFQSMPEFDGAEGFPSPADNLPARPARRVGALRLRLARLPPTRSTR